MKTMQYKVKLFITVLIVAMLVFPANAVFAAGSEDKHEDITWKTKTD